MTAVAKCCKEQLLQDAKGMLLVALNLEHEPHMKLQGMSQFRAAWKTELRAISPNSNHSSEAQSLGSVSAAAENETQSTTGRHCCQITSQISIAGERGEHCWPLQLPCGKGELLQKVFVLLPLRDEAMDSAAPLELRPTSPAEPELLSPHSGQAALSQECGLRFDITTVFTARKNTRQFCVEPLLSGHPAPSSLTGALKCPPFLATVWIRRRPLEGNKMGN
ncbi:UNVERIFIED_CONTAM: hypothetical protein FKN15_068991 [Acipenser sinensis]